MFSSLVCSDSQSAYPPFGYSICISSYGFLYSFGTNAFSAHGHKEKRIFPPKQINGLIDIKSICCGEYHTISIDYNGNCFSFGRNDQGQLGIGKTEDELEFTHIPQKLDLPPCKQASCGYYFTICVSEAGNLYSFGINDYGQLGLDNKHSSYIPKQIPNITDVDYICCGRYYSICKTYNDKVYGWGDNDFGQLGIKGKPKKPVECNNWPETITSIKCGDCHTLILSEGKIYSSGSNYRGQLGINNEEVKILFTPALVKDLPEIQRMECGKYSSFCVDLDNNLWVFGENSIGQLGVKHVHRSKYQHEPILNTKFKNIMDISSKGEHTLVKTDDNKIYGFGYGLFSQLGIETSEEKQIEPIRVLIDNEDIWHTFIAKSRAKSARK